MEMGTIEGYGLLIGFALVLIGIAYLVAKRFPVTDVDELVAAGRKVPFGLIAANVCVAWVWTTTLMGATEAGFRFGVAGGFNYAWASAIPFFLFVPLVLRIRKLMPKCTTFVEFARERYGIRMAQILTIYGVILVLYVAMQQAVGIGYVMQYTFGLPYKTVALLAGVIFASYVALAGLRGSIVNGAIQFVLIAVVIYGAIPVLLSKVGSGWIYERLIEVATDPNNPNYNPEVLNWFSASAWRYGLAYVAAAVAQIFLSQGYYSTAVAAASQRSLMLAYIVGGILAWMPIPTISGNILGLTGLAIGLTPDQVPVTTGVSAVVMTEFLGRIGAILFATLVMMAGITTGANGLAGLQAIMTVDVYRRIRPMATEQEQLRFARIGTLMLGVLVGVVAMALEGVSLLLIDIWSGILLSAPCAALILGVFWGRISPRAALVSTALGLIAGVGSYLSVNNDDINWVIGNVVSLILPAIVLTSWALFDKYQFDFRRLREYEPEGA